VGCSITNPIGCLAGAAKSVAGDAFDSIAKDFGKVADSAINWLWGQMSSATAVHLGGAAFGVDVGIVAAITATAAVGLFVIQVITSTLRRDAGGLSRAVKGLLVAFIGGAIAIAVTNVLLGTVDALSAGVVRQATGTNIGGMGRAVLAAGAISSVGNPAGVMLLSLAALVAVAIVWVALMVRKVLIIVSAVFAPLAFAGSLADITVAWTRRWIEVTAALIFSKLILVIIFVVGWGVLDGGVGQAGSGVTQSVSQVVAGILILTVAGFAPWMALKVVHFSGDQFHQLHTLGSSVTAGASQAACAPQKVQSWQSTAKSMGLGGARGTTSSVPQPSGADGDHRPPSTPSGPGASGPPSGGGAPGSSDPAGAASRSGSAGTAGNGAPTTSTPMSPPPSRLVGGRSAAPGPSNPPTAPGGGVPVAGGPPVV
jgi:type IV secretion system protein TrbL